MARRASALVGLSILVFLVIFAWLAHSLPARNPASGETYGGIAESVLRTLESPAVSAWFARVTALLQDHPELAKHLIAKPATRPLTTGLGYYDYFKLTFPQFANGTAGGVSIRSSIILINNGGSTAQGSIRLRQEGWVMNVQTNVGSGNTFSFSLTAGQTFRLETDGSGPLAVGWAEVASDVPISGSAKFTTLDSGGHFLSEVGIGDSVRSNKLMIVVDTTNGKDSGFAVCNPSADTAAKLTLDLRKMDGTSIATASKTLGVQYQAAEFVTQTFPGDTAKNFKGLLVISSEGPAVSLVTLRTQGLNYTSLPAIPEVKSSDTAKDLLFARVGDGVFGTLKLQTSVFLLNNSADPVSAKLELYSEGGDALPLKIGATRAAEFPVTLPAGGGITLESDGSTNPGAVGWARVTTNKPLGGGAAFTLSTKATGALQAEVGVPASPSTPVPAIYVDEQKDRSTALALTNPVGEPVTVRFRLAGQASSGGTLIRAEKQIQLAAHNHMALFLPELFPDVPAVAGHDFAGCLEAEAWLTEMGEDFLSDLAGLTLLTHGTYLTSAPVAEHMVNFDPRVTLRPATLLEGSAPAFRLELRQMAGEIPMKVARIKLDKGSFDLTGIKLGASVGQATARIQIFLLMGRLFVYYIGGKDYVEFYSPLTLDGVGDWEPFSGRIENQTGGGVMFEVRGEGRLEPTIEMSFGSTLDFAPKLTQLPSGAGTVINVTEEYESEPFYSTPDSQFMSQLKSSRTTTLTLSGLAAAAPRVNSVTPSAVFGGQQITVDGANFAASTSGNTVTVEGNSRVAATVLEATATRLVVQLPDSLRTGNLRVTTGGKDSNDYLLQVLFAPVPKLTLGNQTAGASTPLRLDIGEHVGEIDLDEVDVTASEGEWITTGAGLTAGTIIGSAGIEDPEGYDLRVRSSDSDQLIVDMIKKGETKAAYAITLCKSCTPPFQFKSVPGANTGLIPTAVGIYSHLVPAEGGFVLNFTAPIFKNPAGAGKTVNFTTKFYSLPQRTMVPLTRLSVERQLSYATQ